ncbi:rust resistance kinase Lr10-like [Prunus dulcis]|uniref:rust resistance kinase Lr10-like n=1 Tax=Prunus dulcis TaxID=3755 RepID=UPI001482D1D8|nr:rust resistance kinase Lr10-like [Prunus dulcis]
MGIIPTEMQQAVHITCLCLILVAFCKVHGETQKPCEELKCSYHGPAIHFPFRIKDRHPDHCGYPGFVVSCNDRKETVLELPTIPVKLSVESINYERQKMYLYDPDNCLVAKLIEIRNMSFSPFYVIDTQNITLFNCSSLVMQHEGLDPNPNYPVAAPCLRSPGHQVYAVDSAGHVEALQSCTKMYNVFSVPYYFQGEQAALFRWSKPNCTECDAEGKKCRLKTSDTNNEIECVLDLRKANMSAFLGSFVLILLVIAAYRVYSHDKNEKENRLKIERFLEEYRALKPSRYSYADIKGITDQFKDKLGEGAYGTVYKGKLSSELFVAVKVLDSSKGDGEDFINEVGAMGHIHHVNVVRLVGFCADGFRRALVYEFLPNGSLQDFISSADSKYCFLGWDKLQDIALGVAQGIEYLHQGCDQRILHFDIKPHNVLLDYNFIPKLSDFGLAKLCSKDESIVSMTTARGTMGYIAPEVFSRNFGKVSYKSDVYSFGMLLLEMIRGKTNIGATTENTNQDYYPEAVYNLLDEGEDPRIHFGEEGDDEIPTKLAIVGLWCIQWNPVDRPSMNAVVQMLEGGEKLTKPPNPFASTGSTRSFATGPSRNLNLELETIVELE